MKFCVQSYTKTGWVILLHFFIHTLFYCISQTPLVCCPWQLPVLLFFSAWFSRFQNGRDWDWTSNDNGALVRDSRLERALQMLVGKGQDKDHVIFVSGYVKVTICKVEFFKSVQNKLYIRHKVDQEKLWALSGLTQCCSRLTNTKK